MSAGAVLRPTALCEQGPTVTLPFDAEKAAASGRQREPAAGDGTQVVDIKCGEL